ncbi:hypothetical protein JVT61DRAFT_12280 [Boletus reticuloceps]|uniref:Uncharacterized protein n=1 Tax=Boletus reticuloceps TaxID=495285 RepID=A0A8I2YED1_9AGAM|nr:hypothetical protein JVT61DRAFT_12280 [Boletus reticuloceps]
MDGTIIQPRWKDFVNKLTTELARYTIFVRFRQFYGIGYLIARSLQSARRQFQLLGTSWRPRFTDSNHLLLHRVDDCIHCTLL